MTDGGKMKKLNYFAFILACFQIAAYSQTVPSVVCSD
jgi:hypothetical protein